MRLLTPVTLLVVSYGDARSTVDRIDYSNDTATVVKGPLNT